MLTIVLRQEGFDSRVCSRGDRALAEFRDYRPDVLLLDLMLPGKDGIDVCKEIRARVRRDAADVAENLTIGELSIDVSGHSVTRGDETISLTPLEFDLLVC